MPRGLLRRRDTPRRLQPFTRRSFWWAEPYPRLVVVATSRSVHDMDDLRNVGVRLTLAGQRLVEHWPRDIAGVSPRVYSAQCLSQ